MPIYPVCKSIKPACSMYTAIALESKVSIRSINKKQPLPFDDTKKMIFIDSKPITSGCHI